MSQSDYIEVTLLKGASFKDMDGLCQKFGDICEFDPANDIGPQYTTFVVHDKKKNRLSFYQGAAGENSDDSYSWQLLIYVGGEDAAQILADHLDTGGFICVYRPEGWPVKVYTCNETGTLETLVDGEVD
jgi:hypothetical protein